MSYGKMNNQITFIQKVKSKDNDGFAVFENKKIGMARAYVQEKNSTEKWANKTILNDASAIFTIRFDKTLKIDRTMMIEFNGDLYEIINIENIRQKNMYVEIIGKLVV